MTANRTDMLLMWAVTIFLAAPAPDRGKLAAAAEEWLTTPGTPTDGYMHRLAIAAQRCAAAPAEQLSLAKEGLREIFDVATRDQPAEMVAQAFDWQTRADTGID